MTNLHEWNVPKYRIDFTAPKKTTYALVIPVINEGQRIIHLLQKIKSHNFHETLDVIIIDGGSKDGSLEFERLKSLGVSVLLTKTDAGKLSSQLRCAYAYCMEKSYQGVVTIDGNDKDDPKDIPKFISLLNEGYDFIQASRYQSGGYEENTPFIRSLAIKFIHAPLLSLSSGFKWTDTTQGFRGYSAKLLLSEKIKVFRDIFREYELLAYLNHRAPRIGMRCIEVGTSRIYPPGEVPTKINFFSGNLKVFATLWKAITGRFNP